MNYLQDLKYDSTRSKVVSTRMGDIEVKEHRGWRYINYNGTKIGLSKIPVMPQKCDDAVFDYIFCGGFTTHPCPAMDFFIYRHRLGNKITTLEYKKKFKIAERV